jgi:hypothetical protein
MNVNEAKTAKEENDLILRIAQRANELTLRFGKEYEYPVFDAYLDIHMVHTGGCPLDLAALLVTDDGNFGHDVFGMNRHLDRVTGKLIHCFVPRFSLLGRRGLGAGQ